MSFWPCTQVQWSPVNKTVVNKTSRLLKPLSDGPDFPVYVVCKENPVIKTIPPVIKTISGKIF